MNKEMNKGQRRMAAIFLALMGILGTIVAMKERVYMEQQNVSETAIEAQTDVVVETEAK